MIQSKQDLEEYIQADDAANHFGWTDQIFNTRCKFLHTLRQLEYHINTGTNVLICKYYSRRLQNLGMKLGWTIGPNCFGKGVYIPHYGCIVVNGTARFGDNCVVQCGVNVSESVVCEGGLYLGAGCKIMIGLHLADGIIIGANAVVTKSFEEPNIVIAGIPAKKISDKGRYSGRIKI